METGLSWLRQLAKAEPGFQFLLLTDKKALPSFPENVLVQELPSFGSFFALKTRWSLRKRIKEWIPAILVTVSDGFTFQTNCPQIVVFSDTAFLPKSQLRVLSKKVSLVSATIFPSRATAAYWQPLLKIKTKNIHVILPPPFLAGKPLNAAEKMQCQLEYTEGRQFFMLAEQLTSEELLINVLKAFSLFKKRQQTNMKLVLPFAMTDTLQSFTNKLSSYKYREDVVVTGSVSEDIRARLAATAYALLVVDPLGQTEACIMEALQLEQPILLPRTPKAEEVAGPSALYTDPDNFQDLADKMMLLYKDEDLRANLISQGKKQYVHLSGEAAIERFRQLLRSSAS